MWSDSELSLLSPQCNLLRYNGAALNSSSTRQSLKTILAKVAVEAAFPRITNVPLHVVRDSVLSLSTRKVKNTERWKIEKEEMASDLERWLGSGFNPRAADIFMHHRDQNFYSATAAKFSVSGKLC